MSINLLLLAAKLAFKSGDRAEADRMLLAASMAAGDDDEAQNKIADVAKELGVY